MSTQGRLFALVLGLLLFVSELSPTSADESDLRLRPNDGVPGETITARGRDFSARVTGDIVWATTGDILATFTADDEGEFEAPFVIPDDAAAGVHTVEARPADGSPSATDTIEVEIEGTVFADIGDPPLAPVTPPDPIDGVELTGCPDGGDRRVEVTNAVELAAALADAQPGNVIAMADGSYRGNFVAEADGTHEQRITLCGTRAAIIDSGDWGQNYALHITGDYWTIHGITISNALKGVMLDEADSAQLTQIEVHTIGHEAVHFRSGSSDGIIQESDIHDTGLERDKFGEGVYVGSAVSNWETYSGGGPDESNNVQILRNRIWATTSEAIDIKEGTSGGLIEGNRFEGSRLSGADSWVDVKGNDYVIRDNHGVNSPKDGFQTHVIDNMGWGRNNLFEANTAEVNGAGVGFYIHNPDKSENIVRCDNVVTNAEGGFGNVECN